MRSSGSKGVCGVMGLPAGSDESWGTQERTASTRLHPPACVRPETKDKPGPCGHEGLGEPASVGKSQELRPMSCE